MLEAIKSMIKQKGDFLEAANVIFEDTVNSDLDDLIILGESEEDDLDSGDIETEGDDIDVNEMDEGKDDEVEDGEDTIDDDNDDGDIRDDTVDDEPEDDDASGQDGGSDDSDDMLDSSIDDELPTPVGAQTGEPINDNIDDLLSMEIDLKSNTPKDLLPIPPANAGEAVPGDDILDQRVDSGYGEESEDPENLEEETADDILDESFIMPSFDDINTPAWEIKSFNEGPDLKKMKNDVKSKLDNLKNDVKGKIDGIKNDAKNKLNNIKGKVKKITGSSDDVTNESAEDDFSESIELFGGRSMSGLLQEAITLGDGGGGDDSAAPTDNADAGNGAPDAGMANDGGENEVTSAVKDKVNEAETSDDTFNDTDTISDVPGTDTDNGSANPQISAEIADEITKISKNLADLQSRIYKNAIANK